MFVWKLGTNRVSHAFSKIAPLLHGVGYPCVARTVASGAESNMAGGQGKAPTTCSRRNPIFSERAEVSGQQQGRQLRGLAWEHSGSSGPGPSAEHP